MKSLNRFLTLLVTTALLNASCKKTQETDQDTDSAAENFLATSFSNDLNNISDEAGRSKSVSSFKGAEQTAVSGSCTTLQFDTLNHADADSITINFGDVNCKCNDLRDRRGKIVVTYTGKYRDSLTTIVIRPTDYFVNNYAVSGSKTIQNLGHNAEGHQLYDITEDISVAKPDNSGTITLKAKWRRAWLNGEKTLVWFDDRYAITGSASGVNSNGRAYVSNITSPLIRDMAFECRRHFISGVIEHTPQNKPKRIIDFGDGSCDNKATVTINGKKYEVELQ